MSKPGSRSRRLTRSLPLVMVLVVSLAVSVSTAASAKPKPDSQKAITAMPSKLSSLRRDAKGNVMTQAERDAQVKDDTTFDPSGNSDYMGAPASKTMLEVDKVFAETNTTVGNGNSSTVASYGLQEDMSAVDPTTLKAGALAQRAVINHQYGSHGGFFLDGTHMSVLDFKQEMAGSDALLTVSSPSLAAQAWSVSPLWSSPMQPGTTFFLSQHGMALTNPSVGTSGAVGAPAQSQALTDGKPDITQLWTMVDAGGGDGTFSLVNRADGLCLVHEGGNATVDACTNDISRHWNQQAGGSDPDYPNGLSFQIYPAGAGLDSSLGSTKGQGVAGPLTTSGSQYWTVETLSAPGGDVPTWSVLRPGGFSAGHVATPMDIAVGDLDGAVNEDASAGGPGQSGLAYHDESVVAFADENNDLQVRVVDYNANASHLLVTAPQVTSTIPLGTGTKLGDVKVGVGDFDGDGHNEIAVAYQDSDGDFTIDIYRYTVNTDGSRTLGLISGGAQPFVQKKVLPNLETGYADLATGDFDGDGRADIALAFATYASATNNNRYANLGVWTINAPANPKISTDYTTRSTEVTAMPTDGGTLPRALLDGNTWTQSGIQLVAGNLLSDPDNGFGPQRSELAVAYNRYYVGSVKDFQRPYTITPVYNIYSVTASCSDVNDCTTTTAPTSSDPKSTEMSLLFPSHGWAAVWMSEGSSYNAPPVSLAIGGFGGTAPDDPPVNGLVASTFREDDPTQGSTDPTAYYVMSSIIVPWQSGETTYQNPSVYDTRSQASTSFTDDWELLHYTSYDRDGSSIILGAPAILNFSNAMKESMVAAAPPAHVDWIDGQFVNVSAGNDFSLVTQQTDSQGWQGTTTLSNTQRTAMHFGSDTKVDWQSPGTTYLPATSKGSIDVNAHTNEQWDSLESTSRQSSTTFSQTASSTASQDDVLTYSADEWTLYRYPVLGTVGQSDATGCTSGCRATYDVYVPQGSVVHRNVAGESTTDYQPDWSNLNALSYPATTTDKNNPVPTPNLGTFTYKNQNGTVVSKTTPFDNEMHTVSKDPGSFALNITQNTEKTTSTQTNFTWDAGLDVTGAYTATVGNWGPADATGKIEFTETATAGLDHGATTGQTQTGVQSTTTSTTFTLNTPSILGDQQYNVATAFYYSKDGAARVVHAVDLSSNESGGHWWTDTYDTPDPALNLPMRFDLNSSGIPVWRTGSARQLIRGFQALQAQNDDSGLSTKGMPYASNPYDGSPITFSVPVHNYSLVPMTSATTANWYAVPVSGDTVTGPEISIGSTPVPIINAQQEEIIQSPTWTAVNTGNAMQQYRIFVVLDEDGQLGQEGDMHPLGGDGCPPTSFEDNGLVSDLRHQGKADPVGCGSDNQGYGLVTIAPALKLGAEQASSKQPANATLAGGGLIGADGKEQVLTESSDIPTVPANTRVTGFVTARSDLITNEHPRVAIYDGPVADGKTVYIGEMQGISPAGGGRVAFSWTPTKPGIHELHQVLLGTRLTGQDDEQIMRIDVAAPLTPYSVTATSSTGWLHHGQPFTISGAVTPVPASGETTVQLQQVTSSGWQTIAAGDTDGHGKYGFPVTSPATTGNYRYRVYKPGSAGRAGGLSDEITVAVDTLAVTAQASARDYDPGAVVSITGTALPAQKDVADRTVDLQRKVGRKWVTVATSQTDANGAYTATTVPKSKGTYTYRVRKRATASLKAVASPSVTVHATKRFAVSVKTSRSAVKPGKATTISGTVTPSLSVKADRTVQLQLRSGTTWQQVATAVTRRSGKYVISVKPGKVGTYTYRMMKVATKGKAAAYSRSVTVRVRR